MPRALKHAGLTAADVQYHEINEAFSVVALVNAKLMNLDIDRVNVFGGAVALGHPIGMSGGMYIVNFAYYRLSFSESLTIVLVSC